MHAHHARAAKALDVQAERGGELWGWAGRTQSAPGPHGSRRPGVVAAGVRSAVQGVASCTPLLLRVTGSDPVDLPGDHACRSFGALNVHTQGQFVRGYPLLHH